MSVKSKALRRRRYLGLRVGNLFQWKQVLLFSSAVAFAFLGLLLVPVPRDVSEAMADENSNTPAEAFLAISSADAIKLDPTIGGATVSDSSTISVTTTNYTGYNLSLSSTSSGTSMNLIAGDSTDPQHSSPATITSLSGTTAASSDNFIGRWGYSTDNTNFSAIPSTSGTTIATKSTSAPTGDNTTLYLGARVGTSQAPGTYAGSLTLTATANPNKVYSITYNKNTTDTVTGMPENISGATTESDTINLSSNTPTRAGKSFKGWCTVAVADGATCSGTAYDPGDEIALDATISNSFTVYAVWGLPSYNVTYVLNGGTVGSSAPTTVAMGTWAQISNPTKSGATFQGWTISGMDDGTEHYYGSDTSSETYTTDTTLYTNVTYFKDLNALSGTVTFTAVWQDDYTYSWSRTTTTYTTSQASTATTLYPTVKTSSSSSTGIYYASSIGINTSGYASLISSSTKSSVSYNNYSYLSSVTGKYICCSNTQSKTNTSTNCSYKSSASSSDSCYKTTSSYTRGTSGSYYYTQITGYKITTTAGTPSTTTLTSSSPTAYSFYGNTASGLTVTKTILNTGVIDYDANGGTGAPARQTFTGITSSSKNVTLSATIPTRQNYTFLGWATSKGATSASYSAGASFSISSAHTTYYAVWTPNYRLHYDANTTDSVANMPQDPSPSAPGVSSLKPTTATFTLASNTPTRTGYTFLGWSTSQTAASGYLSPSATYTTSSAENTLYAMWGVDYSITYNANGGTGAPAAQSGNAAVVTISATEPTLSGKYFHGWASSSSATEVEFKAGKAYAVSNFVPSKTLYAVWKDEPVTLFMQDVDSWGDSLAIGDSVQAVDARDDKTYWVTRLKTSADGSTSEIWMTQNLDYDIKADGTDELAVIGGTTTTTWNSTYPAHATETTLSSHTGYTDTYSWDPGDYYVVDGGKNVSTACTTWRPSSTCQGTTKLSYDLTSTDAKDKAELHYHLGNYYQWNTATAGYGGTETSKDINYSICPKGWRLPTSNSTTADYSFGKLLTAYSYSSSSDEILLSSPLWFVRAGYVNYGSLYFQGSRGIVWSSRAYSNSYNAYYLCFYSSYVDPSLSYYRDGGFSVRCVAE